jgi:hypothetical protein
MGNMSYCQFENTFKDLEQCFDAMQEGDELSTSEEKYKRYLIELCHQIIELDEQLKG